MKKTKRMLAMLLAVIMALCVISGCTGTTTTSSEAASTNSEATTDTSSAAEEETIEPVELTFAYWDIDSMVTAPDGNVDAIWAAIQENTKTIIEPVNITWDDFDEKVKMWASTDSLPDMFAGYIIGSTTFSDWKDQGIIAGIPQEQLADYPDLEEYMNNSGYAQGALYDGKYYCIPRMYNDTAAHTAIGNNIVYRWDLAQEAGITEEPTTWDEFIAMLEAIVAADPEGKGIGGITGGSFSTISGYFYSYGEVLTGKWVLDENDQWTPGYFANVDGVKVANQMARDLYTDGLIDKDIALNTYDSAAEKFLQGKFVAHANFYDGPQQTYGVLGEDYKNIYGTELYEDCKFADIYPSVNGLKFFQVGSTDNSETYIRAGVSDEQMAGILRFFDYLHSEEGNALCKLGFEGEDWEEVDGKKVITITDEERKAKYNCRGASFANWGPQIYDETWPSNYPEEVKAMHFERLAETEDAYIPAYSEQATLYITPLRQSFVYNATDDMLNIMVGSDPVDDMVDALMAEYEKDGLSDMLEEYNTLADEAGISKDIG